MKKLIPLGLILLLLAPGALAQDAMKTTIAMLRYGGPEGSPTYVETRINSMLENYGYINADERAALDQRQDLEGENINVYWGDAGWDIVATNLMVERALDQGADIIVTLTTPVSRTAVNATLDMDEPPLLLLTSVLYPYPAGIADSACDKPDHVIGAVVEVPVQRLFSMLLTQQPDVERIGVLGGSTEISGTEGIAAIVDLAEEHGLDTSVATMISQSDALPAIEGLMNKDIDAVMTSWDIIVSHNMPRITEAAAEVGLPVYVPALPLLLEGASFTAGYLRDYEEAIAVARLLAKYLAGELDPATTGLLELRDPGTGVNLDALEALGMMAAPELVETADFLWQDNAPIMSERYLAALVTGDTDIEVGIDDELDASIVASIQCADG